MKKNNHFTKLLSLLILIVNIFCSCAQTKKQDTFEGEIIYKINVTSKSNNSLYNDYQIQKYGDKLKLTISKDGSFKREFLSSGQKGFDFFCYNSKTNEYFTKWKNIDTIYTSKGENNSLNFIKDETVPNDTINGEQCAGYSITGEVTKGGQNVSLTYYYPTNKEYINPELYRNYKDGFYNQIIDKMKSPFYKLNMDMGKFIVTFTIETIERKNISTDFITNPKNLAIVEMQN